MTDRDRFPITLFADVYGQDLIDKEMSLEELRDLVLTTTARQKTQLPLLKLANFGTERNAESQSLRHNANVTSVTGVEGDYDAMQVPFRPRRRAPQSGTIEVSGLHVTKPRAVGAEVARHPADVHGP
jgi:hypothetical protein